MAQEADPPNPSQMLQILYKSFTKRSILKVRAPHCSGGRSSKSFSNASNPLQILYKTLHLGARSVSWLKRSIFQMFLECFKSFTNPARPPVRPSLGLAPVTPSLFTHHPPPKRFAYSTNIRNHSPLSESDRGELLPKVCFNVADTRKPPGPPVRWFDGSPARRPTGPLARPSRTN